MIKRRDRFGSRGLAVIAAIAVFVCADSPGSASSSQPADQSSNNRHDVAVIIGNKTYRGRTPAVDFAHNDAEAMRRFVIDRLGYRPGNVIDLRDATKAEIERVFGTHETHEGQLFDWVRADRSDVVVFYSGHGVPGLDDKRGYLLPVDGDPNRARITGYSVDLLYANLAKIGAKSVTVYLDACFSGDSPKGMLVRAASGLVVAPRMPVAASGLIVLTAATGDQLASWDEDARHGLFTLHLLKALGGTADGEAFGNGDNRITMAEVKRYLDMEMTYQARRRYGRRQNVSVRGNGSAVLATLTPGTDVPSRFPATGFAAVEAGMELSRADRVLIQHGLNALMQNAGPADGLFGARTRQAIRSWQTAKGLAASGYLNKDQAEALIAKGKEGRGTAASDPSRITLDSGLTLGDWTLLADGRMKSGDHGKLILEAAALRRRHGDVPELRRVLEAAVMADLRDRQGMRRLVQANQYRRRYGPFPALSTDIEATTKSMIDGMKIYSDDHARAALARIARLRPIVGDSPALLAVAARSHHRLKEFDRAKKRYSDWLRTAPRKHPDRNQMALGLFKSQRHEGLGPNPGEMFRDCPNCPEMVVIPAGWFRMGTAEKGYARSFREEPKHRVTITKPFAAGKFEVTFAEWRACVANGGCKNYRSNDHGWGRGRRPVINVSWDDAKSYVSWLSRKTGQNYRLLTESEWEYVARAGSTTRYSWGPEVDRNKANCDGCGSRWDSRQTAPVGRFKANGFGLHDLLGNVSEWVEDCWNKTYRGAPSDGSAWNSGKCGRRVLRGGSWLDSYVDVRSAYRISNRFKTRFGTNGFRIAKTLY